MCLANIFNHNFKKGSFRIYDKNNIEIYYERLDGYWRKRKIYKNKVLYENSHRYWEKFRYDTNGNQIYYENSHGFIKGKK